MAEFDQNMSFEYGPAALFPGNNTLSPPSEGAFGDGNEERGFLRGSIVEKTQPYRTGVKLEAMPNSEDVSSRNRGALQSTESSHPPVVIDPSDVEHINITLEKNQQCACKACGKLFNSVWYLKQHAVKHSNDRPFKCKYCLKTYKFRSNLYQHKCPDRVKSGTTGRRNGKGVALSQPAAAVSDPLTEQMSPESAASQAAAQASKRMDTNQLLKNKCEANLQQSMAANNGAAQRNVADSPASQQMESQTMQPPVDQLMSNGFSDLHSNGMVNHSNGMVNHFEEDEVTFGICIRQLPPMLPPILPPPPPQITRPQDCIRHTPMSPEEVERYILANKERLHTCRKCRLHFPSEETLARHLSAHTQEEVYIYKCESCPQAFETRRELSRHQQLHVCGGPWRCGECNACFRSNMALRRHLDQSRPCRYRPFDLPTGVIETASAPLDTSSFIISEADKSTFPSPTAASVCVDRSLRGESGIGSSPESMHNTTPDSTFLPSTSHREPFEEDNLFFAEAASGTTKKKDDEGDSGFRSRHNSVAQSCSPSSSSAFSSTSDGGSPEHKLASSSDPHVTFGLSSFGSGSSYGQKLFHYEPQGDEHAASGSYNKFSPGWNREQIMSFDDSLLSVRSTRDSGGFYSSISILDPRPIGWKGFAMQEVFVDCEAYSFASILSRSTFWDDGYVDKDDALDKTFYIRRNMLAGLISLYLIKLPSHRNLKFSCADKNIRKKVLPCSRNSF